jgi:exosortase A-associated hydrolase 1
MSASEPGAASANEIPIVFECKGCRLVGVVHRPAQPQARGLLSIVAGGPQYRGGLARMQVRLARRLAAAGVPVMRFDYRGLGDSEGEFRGFRDIEADIAAALRAFAAQVPELREVSLWGGCDASSASLINGWKFPQVTGLLLGNPFVHSEETGDQVAMTHYRRRLRDKDFWLKLLRGGYNPLPAVNTLLRANLKKARRLMGPRPGPAAPPAPAHDNPALPFQERMRLGLLRFKGEVLVLVSGRSLVSQEFDQLIVQSSPWQQALAAPSRLVRVDLPDADQTYSTFASQQQVMDLVLQWMRDPAQVPGPQGREGMLEAAHARLSRAVAKPTGVPA